MNIYQEKFDELYRFNKAICYDKVSDVCRMGHSAGTGSPLTKCCQFCNEFGQNPGGTIVVDGEETFS